MADCCAEIRNELAALRAEISRIQRVDEESIILRAVSRADAQIMPKVAGIALATVLAQLAPWKARFATIEGMSGDALNRARQALERAYNAESVAGAASNAANGAASKAASALAQIAALAASIASILIAIGTLYALGSRIDAVENGLSRLGNDVSGILGRLLGIKQTAERADGNASNALNRADGAQSLASAANSRANIADSTANRATQEAGQAQATAEQAKQNARDARSVAERAQGTAQQAQSTADKAQGTAQQAQTTADKAQGTAQQAQTTANKAQGTAQQAQTTADKAQGTAQQAQTTADKAQGTAQQAQTTADKAQGTAQQAQGTAEKAFAEARKAREYVDKRVGDLRTETQYQIVPDGIWREVPPITIKLVGGIVDPLKQADAKLSNEINEINQRYGDIANLSNVERFRRETELELAKFKREADLNSKQSQGDLDLLRRRFDQTVKDFDDAWTASRKDNIKFTDALKRIENQRLPTLERNQQQQDKELTKINDRIDEQDGDLDKINDRLREQEEVNKDGTRKLDQLIPTIGGIDRKLEQIIPSIGAIPLIPGRVINGIKPSIPTVPQIKKATKDGVCEEFQGNGCAVNALNNNANNISNNINRSLGDKLDKVAQGFNSAANAAQLGLLNTINTKLGDQLPGGIGGKLTRLSKWLHLDRVLNVLIWWQTLHNAYMLSANLGQTLTGMISNVLAAIGIKDAEGSPLNIGEILGNQFDSLAKSVLGESEWGTIKAEWKKWNRIYQAAANLMNSIQSIGYSILSALEVVGSWVASIGNALRRWGEVAEKAYQWMNPTPNFQNKFFTTLESTQNVVSQIDQVASEVLSIQDTVRQIGEQKDEFTKSFGNTKVYIPARLLSATQPGAGGGVATIVRGLVSTFVQTETEFKALTNPILIETKKFKAAKITLTSATSFTKKSSRITGAEYKKPDVDSISSPFGQNTGGQDYEDVVTAIRGASALTTFLTQSNAKNRVRFTPEG